MNKWEIAFSKAATALCEHGIEIRCPWDGDLDDLEKERFDGMVAAIDAYLSIYAPKAVDTTATP